MLSLFRTIAGGVVLGGVLVLWLFTRWVQSPAERAAHKAAVCPHGQRRS